MTKYPVTNQKTKKKPWNRQAFTERDWKYLYHNVQGLYIQGMSTYGAFIFYALSKFLIIPNIKKKNWSSLEVQWIWICLLMQGARVWSLVWEDSTCQEAIKPMCHYWAHGLEFSATTTEPACSDYWSPRASSPCSSTVKPLQWEQRPLLTTVRESPRKESNEDPAQQKNQVLKERIMLRNCTNEQHAMTSPHNLLRWVWG